MKSFFDFSDERVYQNALDINKDINMFKVNSVKGKIMNEFIDWVMKFVK